MKMTFTNGQALKIEAGPPVPQTPNERKHSSSRAGSWGEFVRRFAPIANPEVKNWDDYLLNEWGPNSPASCDPAHIWTVVDYEGDWYVVEGWHHCNRCGYILCKNPRAATSDQRNAYKAFKY